MIEKKPSLSDKQLKSYRKKQTSNLTRSVRWQRELVAK